MRDIPTGYCSIYLDGTGGLVNGPACRLYEDGCSDYHGSREHSDCESEWPSELCSPVVNTSGRFERFDEISLSESEDSAVTGEELELFLTELSEEERGHIVDVMCRDLQLEIAVGGSAAQL